MLAILEVWGVEMKSLLSWHVDNSSGTNHVINEHEDFGQYVTYAIPSQVMPCYSYLVSFMNQSVIPIDSAC